jgi:transposase-like protein
LELSGYIERKDKTILDNVTEIQMNDEKVYAHTSSSYYVLDTSTHQLTEFSSPSDEIDLVSAEVFYNMRYREMNRIGWIVIALISLAVSTSLTRVVFKFIR